MTRLWLKEKLRREYEQHQLRLSKAQPTVDDHHSKPMPYGKDREKERKWQHVLVEEKNRQIIDQIGKAMQCKQIDNLPPSNSGYVATKMGVIGPGAGSLVDIQRKRELKKITDENKRMLRRIQLADPVYNRTKWEQDALRREQLLRVISEFPETAAGMSSGNRSAMIVPPQQIVDVPAYGTNKDKTTMTSTKLSLSRLSLSATCRPSLPRGVNSQQLVANNKSNFQKN